MHSGTSPSGGASNLLLGFEAVSGAALSGGLNLDMPLAGLGESSGAVSGLAAIHLALGK